MSNRDLRIRRVAARHNAGVRDSFLRRELALELSPSRLNIDPTQPHLSVSGDDLEYIRPLIAEGKERQKRFLIGADLTSPDLPKKIRLPEAKLLGLPDRGLGCALIKFALQKDLIAAISAYLGFVPILTTAEYWFSPNRTAFCSPDDYFLPTQLTHLDWADDTLVKVFVHCSDVVISSGPVCIASLEATEAATQLENFYSDDLDSTRAIHFTDESMEQLGCPTDTFSALIGKSGSIHLVDTARLLHFGGRNTSHRERLLAVFLFLRPGAPKLDSAHCGTPPFSHLTAQCEDLISRLVLGGKA